MRSSCAIVASASIASYPHIMIRSRQLLCSFHILLLEVQLEVTMSDLPQALLAHLQREAKDEHDRARASREETEKELEALSKCATTPVDVAERECPLF
jgi:hypothetical protein